MSPVGGGTAGWRGWRIGRLVPVVIATLTLALAVGVVSVRPAGAASHSLGLGSPREGLVFVPSQLTITAGDVVTVEVQALGPHNLIVEGHPEWSHEPLAFREGERWQQRFDTPGRYRFWCEPHRFAGMEGMLIVEPAA